ncbi:anaphase-promoting complex subunit cdc27 [Elasticomyces elasticus]|uniref:Anaphase-promoting complex subunit cdc27 n=1 Tax=Exophiala sideris TaxID=1016849 RepID=A0ABR0JR80_9EURO|nr:anaphase-promoting complex subunit cdc27 [Elasticomyces elasticus]KAK5034572.1 anaphase-promoting complex subunit cdc27 [Exophiala sideris]KAK5040107.1 anaphase-promoting complex subunit cdc27 [Exophiala sideris]KAK5068485.1 anaphase-promoting complex subunit cdc27 [Exophiala sideris]KAK5187787.1 anaphase-promoting complex subunit cdc27 [Eurotiomycetes sp. CCFEE 6388]
MAPSATHIAAQLRQLVYYHLDNNLLKNALFLAGRLVAYEPRSAEAAYLLAYCQYQSGFVKAAWDTSRSSGLRGSHLGCSYVFAQASLELGRNVDGLTALEKSKHFWSHRNTWGQHNESRRQHLPDAAAVLCLRGKLWKAHKNVDQAVESWASALKLNPFMWDAFTGLCDAGAKVSVPNIYKMSPEMIAYTQIAQRQTASNENVPSAAAEKSGPSVHEKQPHGNQMMPPDPFVTTQKINGNSQQGHSVLWEKLNGSKISVNTASTVLDEEGTNTPSTEADVEEGVLQGAAVNQFHDPPAAPARKTKSATEMPADPPPRWKTGSARMRAKAKGASDDTTVLQDPPPPAAPSKRTVSGQPTISSHASAPGGEGTRRSNRLLNTTRPPSASSTAGSKISSLANTLGLREGRDIKKAKAPAVRARTANTSTVGRVVSGNRTRTGSADAMDVDSKGPRAADNIPPVPPLPNAKVRAEYAVNKDIEAIQTLLDLFGRVASAQLCLSNYDCQTAIQIYNSLPSAQRETPYVLAQIGKAYYEQAQYVEAEKFFIRVRQLAPTRLEDMEIYSTVLWHLKSEIELACLAHELIEVDRLSPQAWCAIGNSFSLQREHEQALKCFKRSTQLDPQFAYGFTLQGHEYISNEEFEKALEAYRAAIAADGRHYNAWYGLGKVYEKMGKWTIAEQHYRTAAKINPTNAVLICCIGLVLERLKEPEKALQMYTRACTLAPNSALSRFKKARCLMSLGRPRDALTELLILRDVVPDEANVWFLMGRLYKTLREKGNAVRAFTMALNLDPKAAQFIKDAMESLDDEDEDGYDEDEDMD